MGLKLRVAFRTPEGPDIRLYNLRDSYSMRTAQSIIDRALAQNTPVKLLLTGRGYVELDPKQFPLIETIALTDPATHPRPDVGEGPEAL